jgi:sortase A
MNDRFDTQPGADTGHQQRPERRSRRRRLLVTGMGVVLLWGALGLTGYAAGWQLHKRQAQATLLGREQSVVQHVARQEKQETPQKQVSTPCVVSAPQTGQLAGVLHIPALNLTAPVEEGTDDAELNVSVGHDASSVWPGQTGTAVFLAHDVSYFVHLNQLQPGDRIVYQTACNSMTYTVSGQQVVQQGSTVGNSTTPTLVLDTCYPPNALFFTTQRLLVTAVESTGTTATTGGGGGGSTGAGSDLHVPTADLVSYSVPAPPALVAQGLTLEQNEAPMGTMTLAGQTSPTWEQSPGPLALEAAALEAYFGGIDSAEQTQPDWWAAIAGPWVPPPGPLLGAAITGHDSPLDVEIDSSNGVADQVVLRTTVTISGGSAPGTYDETVTTVVQGSTVRIGSWTLAAA